MTKTSTHIAAFIAAALMTVATQGSMLLQFDKVAQQGSVASTSAAAVVKLDTVTIVARRA